MKRPLLTLSILAISVLSGSLASAQHHGRHHSAMCNSSRSGYIGASYGYGYNPGVSYEESVMRGMGYYAQATAQANLYNAQAANIHLDNELKAVQNRYAKGAAMAQGKANVKIAKENERIAAAEIRQKRHEELVAAAEKRRREARVDVDLSQKLRWPGALQDASLASLRSDLQAGLGGDRFAVSAGSVDVEAVQAAADKMFAHVLARRDDLGQERVVAAKRYLDGVVRAAQSAAESKALVSSDLAAK